MGGGCLHPHTTPHKFSMLLGVRVSEEGSVASNVSECGLVHMRTCVPVPVSSHCTQESVLLAGGEHRGKASPS